MSRKRMCNLSDVALGFCKGLVYFLGYYVTFMIRDSRNCDGHLDCILDVAQGLMKA